MDIKDDNYKNLKNPNFYEDIFFNLIKITDNENIKNFLNDFKKFFYSIMEIFIKIDLLLWKEEDLNEKEMDDVAFLFDKIAIIFSEFFIISKTIPQYLMFVNSCFKFFFHLRGFGCINLCLIEYLNKKGKFILNNHSPHFSGSVTKIKFKNLKNWGNFINNDCISQTLLSCIFFLNQYDDNIDFFCNCKGVEILKENFNLDFFIKKLDSNSFLPDQNFIFEEENYKIKKTNYYQTFRNNFDNELKNNLNFKKKIEELKIFKKNVSSNIDFLFQLKKNIKKNRKFFNIIEFEGFLFNFQIEELKFLLNKFLLNMILIENKVLISVFAGLGKSRTIVFFVYFLFFNLKKSIKFFIITKTSILNQFFNEFKDFEKKFDNLFKIIVNINGKNIEKVKKNDVTICTIDFYLKNFNNDCNFIVWDEFHDDINKLNMIKSKNIILQSATPINDIEDLEKIFEFFGVETTNEVTDLSKKNYLKLSTFYKKNADNNHDLLNSQCKKINSLFSKFSFILPLEVLKQNMKNNVGVYNVIINQTNLQEEESNKIFKISEECENSLKNISGFKINFLKEILKNFKSKKIIITHKFTSVLNLIKKKLEDEFKEIDIYLFEGKLKYNKRSEKIDLFNKYDNIVLLISSKCATGLNLKMGDILINLEVDLSVSDQIQLESRIRRLDINNNKIIFNLIEKNENLKYFLSCLKENFFNSVIYGKQLLKIQDIKKIIKSKSNGLKFLNELTFIENYYLKN